MLASRIENICAAWNELVLPNGESMNTRMLCLPAIAASAALPVSPEVAPKMFSSRPVSVRTCSNRWPSNCMAMSLKAKVGPLLAWARCKS